MRSFIFFSVFVLELLSFTMQAEIREVDSEELSTVVLPNMKKPIVLDFWASWCGPCRQYSPTFKSVAQSQRRYADFYKVEIDYNQDLVSAFDISCVPTTIVIYSKSGEYLKAEGVLSASQLSSMISKAKKMLDLSDSF